MVSETLNAGEEEIMVDECHFQKTSRYKQFTTEA
jgi:hypothetical protein